MADAPETTPAPAAASPPPSSADTGLASPQTDPTPAQVESRTVVSKLSTEIDDLWKQAEKPPAERATPEPAAPPAPVAEAPPVAEAKASDTPKPDDQPKADAPKTEDAPPPTQAELEQRAYEKAKADFEAQQDATRKAAERLQSEQAFQSRKQAYTGSETDYQAVNAALRAYLNGDALALDSLDVTLPNGQKVSQVKAGQKGLTEQEAATLLNAWDMARGFEDVMGDQKVGRVIQFWNDEVISVLQHPDVDGPTVMQHQSPGKQMQAVIESVAKKVTDRLTTAHTAELAARDKTIAEQAQRIESLVNERGNLTSQRAASEAASPDRPGQAGAPRRALPSTPEDIKAMPYDEFFKSGMHERLLSAIPGGLSPQRRRAG